MKQAALLLIGRAVLLAGRNGGVWAARSKRISLILGVLLFGGAGLWCLGGAGIYGSPLAEMQGEELTRVWVFLVAGPFSALPAAIVGKWRIKLSAGWFILGGLLSGGVAVTFLGTDAGILPLMLASLPMVLLGIGLALA